MCKAQEEVDVAKSRRSLSRKPSLKKRVSFDETPPVEISRESSQVPVDQMPNGTTAYHGSSEDECEVDMLPELQEDDLFSTYDSLKAHASPSPPPLLWTDLSKDEKKTLAIVKTPENELYKSLVKTPESELYKSLVPEYLYNKVDALDIGGKSTVVQNGDTVVKPITFRELDVSLKCFIAGGSRSFIKYLMNTREMHNMELWQLSRRLHAAQFSGCPSKLLRPF